jgi:hypothetical protein
MSSFQIISPIIGKSFSAGSVVEANGKHSLDTHSFVWAVLHDTYGHYYLQNPPVTLNPDGNWISKNLHLGHDIDEIIFVQVNQSEHEDFLQKVKNHDWGAFDALPAKIEKLGSVRVNVR